MEVSGQLHAQAALPPGEKPQGTHWIGVWVDLVAAWTRWRGEKFPALLGIEFQSSSP